jgi:GxxExxY protein
MYPIVIFANTWPMVDNLKYADITKRVIGASMTVHRDLGGGNFTEKIFQRALLLELTDTELECESEKELPVFYKGKLIGKKRVDLFVNGKVLVELKAVSQFEKIHFNQVINYLIVFNIEVGLLINFGSDSLQVKRFVNNKYKNEW